LSMEGGFHSRAHLTRGEVGGVTRKGFFVTATLCRYLAISSVHVHGYSVPSRVGEPA
jgi:hypothetical protein